MTPVAGSAAVGSAGVKVTDTLLFPTPRVLSGSVKLNVPSIGAPFTVALAPSVFIVKSETLRPSVYLREVESMVGNVSMTASGIPLPSTASNS